MGGAAQRDVAHGELRAGDEVAALQRLFEQQRAGGRALDRGGDGGGVALCFGRADQAQEGRAQGGLPLGGLPVHPAVGIGAHTGIGGPQRARAIARGQIAHDGVGFPEHEAAVVDHGHAAVGIHAAVLGRVQAAEGAAGFGQGVGQGQFAHGPDHFLYVDGTQPSPDLQHCCPRRQRGGRSRRRKPAPRAKRGQSKAGPGSVLRPGAISSCPQAARMGRRARRRCASSARTAYCASV